MTSQIRRAETLLHQAGFGVGKIDGQSTATLVSAIKEFQTAWGLPATGLLDPGTLAKLDRLDARFKNHASKEQFISVGQKSSAIATVQKQLRALGYTTGTDGLYTRETAAAVKAFRADQANLKDGGAFLTKGSRAILADEVKQLHHASERQRKAPSAAQNRADAATTTAARTGIDASDRGAAVSNVQRHLRAAGFDPQRTSGVFDERTAAMVKTFQSKNKLPVTGTVDARTWRALQKSYILSKKPASPAQAYAERSGAVKSTETLLKKSGFNPGPIDGYYSRNTEKAVRRWEQKNHRHVDGKIGEADLAALKRTAAKNDWKHAKPPPADYRRIGFRGVTVNVRTKVMVLRAEQYMRDMGIKQKLSFSQGSYHGGVKQSGGTHDGGGALDIRVGSMSMATQRKMVKALRMAGFAAWARTPADGFAHHIHAEAIGDRQSTAKWQWAEYFHKQSGLSGSGSDRDGAHIGYWDSVTPDWAKRFR
ncbi:MAG: peptidoglycan-binding protein [Archangiaceae bacterium]|nr:peptidoglycan-binding protein [Archangiaceae bacterium]